MGNGVKLGLSFLFVVSALAQAGVERAKFTSNGKYLMIEVLQDDLLHFEVSAKLPGPHENDAIPTTEMVVRRNYSGPEVYVRGHRSIETKALIVQVNDESLCVRIQDKAKNIVYTDICPSHLDQYWKGLTLSRANTKNLYGLGQEFHDPGVIDGDWMGRVRHYGGLHGNKMVHFNGGDNGNTQIPVLYGLGEGTDGFALFLDQVYQQQWDFKSSPWTVEMYGDQIRFYFFSGNTISHLRKGFMELVGKPLVPPKKAFGLWLSEYGYRNWEHLESRLDSMRKNHFPLDGFMLDLYWFGGIKSYSDDTAMGRLDWDTEHFPRPKEKMAELKEKGIGIVPIEESYIGKNLHEHRELAKRGYLVKDGNGNAAYLNTNGWWGHGGMMDWTNPATNDFWHKWKRAPLVEAGILGHWIDLGEPEIYPHEATYHGNRRQADVHNIYNLKWAEGIHAGYDKYTPDVRPFILSRSGAAGIQRHGAVMWSGDIGSDLTSLASHMNAQMHMSLSGVDYYGADIGGFHREGLQGDLDEMYTQWLSYGSLFDVPARPHTENLCQCRETAPDRIGDVKSNLDNVRLRYRLIPYLYSLAHSAFRDGEPVYAPLVYYFQSDPNVRTIAREKMIGPSLLAAVVAKAGQKTTDVYLPQGKWYDFHTGALTRSRGQKLNGLPLYVNGRLRLPIYAKAGAIIPVMHVDDKTMDSSGKRTDGTVVNELRLKIFSDNEASRFTFYEDDGATTRYLKGQVRETLIQQSGTKGESIVTIEGAKGSFDGAYDRRAIVLELRREQATNEVSVDGRTLDKKSSLEDWEKAESGWFAESSTRVLVKTASLDVKDQKTLRFR